MKRSVRIALAGAATVLFAIASPPGTGTATAGELNYQGIWWNAPAASESGWGINFAHQGDTIFATWFTFGADGKPLWLVAAANRTSGNVYVGDIYTGTGTPYNQAPFDPAQVVPTKVGTATLTFADDKNAVFAYTVNGVSQTRNLTPQLFADPQPTCVWDVQADPALATNFQGMWWASPPGSESGWGVNFAHQGDTIFATWFTFGVDGKPLWFVVAATRDAPNVYSGTLYTGTGPAFSSMPFDPAKVVSKAVGNATFTLADGNNATFTFTVDGVSWTKQITRQVFNVAATICSAPLSAADKRKDAARFLRQATFGAPREAIDALVTQGYPAWIDEQFGKSTLSSVALFLEYHKIIGEDVTRANLWTIWKPYFEGEDQLRQRVSNALSQIFVISFNNTNVAFSTCAAASYLDILNRGAFGNARDLLKDVTLAPVMGEYLSMKGSAKADPVLQTQPDENFAREVMQLFSVGLVMLNDDGSVKRDPDGRPIPTFNEDTVKGFARALSGWTHAGQDQTKPWRWLYPDIWDDDLAIRDQKACPAWSKPMQPWTASYRASDNVRDIAGPAHDVGAKQLLVYPGAPYSALPAGQSPQTDLENVIDNIFFHPNVGPFLGRQLIQRLVTSNPSPQYVRRVAQKFNDNGSGVRGDMKAVVRAILLDSEARSLLVASQPSFGKLTEPVLRFVQFFRAFNGRSETGHYELQHNLGAPSALNQHPLYAPSVFNFYHPNFTPAGPLGKANLVGPEFEITNASSVAGFAEFSDYGIARGYAQNHPLDGQGRPLVDTITPDFGYYLGLTGVPGQLLDELELVLCARCLNPALKAQIAQAVGKIFWNGNPAGQNQERLYTALWLIINSPDYSVQK